MEFTIIFKVFVIIRINYFIINIIKYLIKIFKYLRKETYIASSAGNKLNNTCHTKHNFRFCYNTLVK